MKIMMKSLITLIIFSLPLASFGKEKEHAASSNSANSSKESWAALAEIQAGNKRYSEGKPNHAGQDKEDRNKLTSGQTPPVIVLSCSDSRVPPEKIFDQGLGQIFTVRLAGHVINSDAIASIEYALEHLGSKVLVVMGHESCGAVKAALTTPRGQSTGSPHIDSLIAKIRPSVEGYKNQMAEDKTLSGPVKANVTATVKDLVKRSKVVRELIEKDKLLIAQSIYHLGSGEVDFWSVGQPLIVMGVEEQHARKVASSTATPPPASTPTSPAASTSVKKGEEQKKVVPAKPAATTAKEHH